MRDTFAGNTNSGKCGKLPQDSQNTASCSQDFKWTLTIKQVGQKLSYMKTLVLINCTDKASRSHAQRLSEYDFRGSCECSGRL